MIDCTTLIIETKSKLHFGREKTRGGVSKENEGPGAPPPSLGAVQKNESVGIGGKEREGQDPLPTVLSNKSNSKHLSLTCKKDRGLQVLSARWS